MPNSLICVGARLAVPAKSKYPPMKNPLPNRRSIRLPKYDYSQDGVYSVTICTCSRQYLFGEIINCRMDLNEIGVIADNCWRKLPNELTYVHLLKHVVMLNHLHGIIVIDNDGQIAGTASRAPTRTEAFGKPTGGSLPSIIRSYKSGVTRRINQTYPNLYSHIWQRGYYERVVRNERELKSKIDYIITNPDNWEKDPERLL
jgi:REP element-mobilizing transposase RayT